MNRQGFSLIETIIYCGISALIGILICQFYTTSYRNFQHAQHTGQQLMALYAAHDLLMRDLESASCSLRDWHVHEQLVCKINSQCVGWECKAGKLYRTIGSYDFKRNAWEKKSQALVAQNVTTFDYHIDKNNNVVAAISINLGLGNGAVLKKKISLFNRILP